MRIKKVTIWLGIFIGILTASSLVFAENRGDMTEKKEHETGLHLKKVFLSKETREKIDQQREAYLNPITEKEIVKLIPKNSGTSTPKKKRIYIPPKVNVSLVMVKPDGSRLVRVNNKYNHSPSKHIKMDFSKSSQRGVPVIVQGKVQIVPVGSTLLTRKNKLVKTYKLEQAKRKKSAPKTEQKAVKERLEQVKMLQPK